MLTKLDIVNAMLATLGEVPLNSFNEYHPMLAGASDRIDGTLRSEQARGWWFNKEMATFPHDPTTGEVTLSGDLLTLKPEDPRRYVQRGSRLYDRLNGTYRIGRSVRASIIRLLPLEEVPPTFAEWIKATCVERFQADYDGDTTKGQRLTQQRAEAGVALNAEDIRNSDVNLLETQSLAIKMGAIRPGFRRSNNFFTGG